MDNPETFTLYDAINQGLTLTQGQHAAAVYLLACGCHAKNRGIISRKLSLPLSLRRNYGIYHRVEFGPDSATYTAGQSYPDEIATIRGLLLKG